MDADTEKKDPLTLPTFFSQKQFIAALVVRYIVLEFTHTLETLQVLNSLLVYLCMCLFRYTKV